MSRHRRALIAWVAAILFAGIVVDVVGPFGTLPDRSYADFLASFEAGRVEEIVRWRDHLQVHEATGTSVVAIPEGTDLTADLARARLLGGVPIRLSRIPDVWVVVATPVVPAVIGVAALLLWAPAAKSLTPARRRPGLLGLRQ